ncbi:hypothetical protein [Teredinibacter sp. KSP-S5-2]|uniref:hypothetical protein n=1 Tax=Teredinibacter sp. KSP-S5-2 TaxID=3034506 RepID=UPI0029343F2D|nr:hypothetical protein [Teredinibacter sp. KSP-S5-2]WNO08628.1 hypothetical protein P5V12_16785 [Teredinibacter sp. KSP-S5-2]
MNNNNTTPHSITFIVGQDSDTKNAFYQTAELFFSLNPTYKTEHMVKSLSSIEGIVNYLHNTPPAGGNFWKTINIVSHSSEYGLNMNLTEDGKQITTKQLDEITQSAFDGFPSIVRHLNSESLITFWGCSFGKQQAHLKKIAQLFNSIDGSVSVRSPNMRIHFFYDLNNNFVDRFYSEEYSIYSDTEELTSSELARAFQYQYPDSKTGWQTALSTPISDTLLQPAYSASTINIKFYAPRDILKTYQTLNQFMLAQPEIMDSLNNHNISINKLNIEIKDTDRENIALINCTTIKHSILTRSNLREKDIMVYADR